MAKTKSPAPKTRRAKPSNGETGAELTSTQPVTAAQVDNGHSDPRKFEVTKADSRGTVVPINLEDEIRRRAYELAERRGFQGGSETEDWLAAEREVLQRYRQQSA